MLRRASLKPAPIISATGFLALGKGRKVEGFIRLLLATIHRDADTQIDDLVVQDEYRILLGCAVSVYSQAREPSGPAQVVDRPHSGNLERPERGLARKNAPDVVCHDLPVVRLGKILGE